MDEVEHDIMNYQNLCYQTADNYDKGYCKICSYDVTSADFENSLNAFGQSEKSKRVQLIKIIIEVSACDVI